MSKRIDYNQNEKWTNGVEVPDGLITAGASDTYKLLESLNIDWENTNIPWATRIRKWNAAGETPSGSFSEYINKVKNAEISENKINNTIDWINSKYDYLSDMSETPEGNTDVLDLLPRWYKDGTIKDSTDIVDLLNYLTWRVITIDYYTDHWDRRNARACIYEDLLYPFDNAANIDFLEGQDKSILGNFYQADFRNSGNRAKVILTPTIDRTPYNLNKSLDNVYTYYNNAGLSNNLYSVIASNNPGEMSVTSSVTANTAIINSISKLNVDPVDYNGELWKFFKIDMDIIGTGNYKPLETWYTDIKSNIQNLANFDPAKKSVDFTVNHTGGSDENGDSFVGSEFNIHLTIEKSDNTITQFKFGNTQIINNNGETFASKLNNSNAIEYGKIYNITFSGTRDNAISMPYYLNDEVSKKEITFDLLYGSEYGIYPYFFIGNSGTYTLDGRDFVEYNTVEYGKIVCENNKYYYIPPVQTQNTDKEFNLYCIFYYKDDNQSRQITPTIISFKIKLKKEVQNRIIFLKDEASNINLYRKINDSYDFRNVTDRGSDWVRDDRETGNYFENNAANNINYCIRTITFEDLVASYPSGNKVSPGPVPNLIFDDFVRVYCDSDYEVEYLGVINSDTSSRNITIYESESDGRYGELHVDEEKEFDILLNNKIKIGQEPDKSFYYCNDTLENYYDISVLNDIINGTKPTEDADLNTTEFSVNNVNGFVTENTLFKTQFNKNKVYDINKSTAIYPDKNGIFEVNNNWVNADTDYYYLVFKIKSSSGSIGSISYSPCKAYYFLKVLRRQKQFNLKLLSDLENYITYTTIGTNNEETVNSFKLVPRIPIYLNRLFDIDSQIEIQNTDANIFWDFYGVDNKDISSRWDDTKVAIKNRNTNEEFIKIYNEGDNYNTINYNSENGKQNNNYLFKPENGVIIPKDFISNGSSSRTVGKFNNASSGSILFVNKLLSQTQYDDINDIYSYDVIPNDSIYLALTCNIGNSSNYVRSINNSTTFNIKINKKTLDIDLYESIDTNSPKRVNYIVTPKKLNKINNNVITINTGSATSLGGQDRWAIHFISNEFGSGTTQNIETLNVNSSDALQIELNNGLTSIKVQNEFIDNYLNVSINSLNMNNNWFINVPDDGSNQQVNLDKNNKFFNIYYFTKLNTSQNISSKYSLSVIGVNDTQNQKYPINVIIDGDQDGVYKKKEITIYVKVEEQSSGDVQTGD